MKTFLSIDLDFFNGLVPDVVFDYLDPLVSHLQCEGIPVTAVMNHQQMLPLVNASRARHLLNLDRHSDLADAEARELNCGTWVGYVRWRHSGFYTWLHRHKTWEGECNDDPPLFGPPGQTAYELSDWMQLAHRQVKEAPSMRKLLSDGIVDASIVLSPAYVCEDLEPVFRALVKDRDLRYIRGVRHESNRRFCRPPKALDPQSLRAMHDRQLVLA